MTVPPPSLKIPKGKDNRPQGYLRGYLIAIAEGLIINSAASKTHVQEVVCQCLKGNVLQRIKCKAGDMFAFRSGARFTAPCMLVSVM